MEKEFLPVQDEVLTIISVLQTDNIYFTPSNLKDKAEKIREKFTNPTSDHLTLLNIYNQWLENRKNEKIWAKVHYLYIFHISNYNRIIL